MLYGNPLYKTDIVSSENASTVSNARKSARKPMRLQNPTPAVASAIAVAALTGMVYGDILGAKVAEASTVSQSAVSSGSASSGTASSGTASSGTASSGTASSGTASSGTASSGTASSGTASSGTASSGTASSRVHPQAQRQVLPTARQQLPLTAQHLPPGHTQTVPMKVPAPVSAAPQPSKSRFQADRLLPSKWSPIRMTASISIAPRVP